MGVAGCPPRQLLEFWSIKNVRCCIHLPTLSRESYVGSKLKTVLSQWEGQEKFRIPGKQPRCDQKGGKGHWEAMNKFLPAYISKQCR